MKVRSTFHISALLIALLTVSSPSVFGRGPHPTKPEVDRKQNAVLLIGDHHGVDETDVQNAVLFVSQELRKLRPSTLKFQQPARQSETYLSE